VAIDWLGLRSNLRLAVPRAAFLLTILLVVGAAGVAQEKPRVVHVFVALADNDHQGIVPVPRVLGNGDDEQRNLYWGAAFGVRTFFKRSIEWKEVARRENPTPVVLQRVVFYCAARDVYLIADAYRGREIRQSIADFFSAAAGQWESEPVRVATSQGQAAEIADTPSLVVYVGHDGLMDFAMGKQFAGDRNGKRQAVMLACASKNYFGAGLRVTGAEPVLWTTGLMAPEAYTLKATLDAWMAGGSGDQIRKEAARAYARYQKISERAALQLFATGW